MRRQLTIPLCLALCALALAGCGTAATSTSGFSGAKHEVAQVIANFQSDANASEPKKICADDLAAGVVTRLGGHKGCEAAIKRQLSQVDEFEVSVQSVTLGAHGKAATASVRSIREGKTRQSALSLVKESGKWKIVSE